MATVYEQGLKGLNLNNYEESPVVKNRAGGNVHGLDKWAQFERFLILGSEGNTYYAGEKELTRENLKVVQECVKEDGLRALATISAYSNLGRAPKQGPLLAAFALLVCEGDLDTRQRAYRAFPQILRIPTFTMQFLAYCEAFGKGHGSGLKQAIGRLYYGYTPRHLAESVTKYANRHGYTMWDIFRIARYKPLVGQEEQSAIVRYVKTGDIDTERMSPEVVNYLMAIEQLKTETNEETIARLILDNKLPREVLPTELLTKRSVWSALLPHMGITAMMRNLANMTRTGLFEGGSIEESMAVQQITNPDVLKKGRVHPMNVLNALKTYESGHGFRGSNTWNPTRRLVAALNDAFYLSYGAVEPSGKNIAAALDVSGSMGVSIQGFSNFSCYEVEAALALVFLNTEQNVQLLAFSDKMVDIPFKRSDTIGEAHRKLTKIPMGGGTYCSLPIRHALKTGLDVDAFVTMTDSETYDGTGHGRSYGYNRYETIPAAENRSVSDYLRHYREEVGHRVTHSVLGFVSNGFTIGDPNDPDILNVAGLDSSVPQLVSNHIRG